MPYPGDPDSYPGKDEVADLLAAYVARFELPVRLNTTVTRLTRDDDGYSAETTTGTITAKQVVIEPARSRSLSFLPCPSSSTLGSHNSTAPRTVTPTIFPKGEPLLLARQIRDSRSHLSSPRRGRSRSPSARSWRRCRRDL